MEERYTTTTAQYHLIGEDQPAAPCEGIPVDDPRRGVVQDDMLAKEMHEKECIQQFVSCAGQYDLEPTVCAQTVWRAPPCLRTDHWNTVPATQAERKTP